MTKICNNCGNPNPPNFVVCGKCGSALRVAPVVAAPPRPIIVQQKGEGAFLQTLNVGCILAIVGTVLSMVGCCGCFIVYFFIYAANAPHVGR